MSDEKMPYNAVGEEPKTPEEAKAAEAAWREKNLPARKLEFHWRYANKTIQLYERRLRSLAQFHVGPAVQAWVRSRLEWMQDNKLHEMPNGVLDLSIDPEGDVGLAMRDLSAPAPFGDAQLDRCGGLLRAADVPGTLWVVADGRACAQAPELVHAADTFTRDLLKTFGYELAIGQAAGSLDGAQVFAIDDEHGLVACQGHGGEACDKLEACFDKLWGAA